jgi:hypothetical protein
MLKRYIKWMVITIPVAHIIFAGIVVAVILVSILSIVFGGRYMDYRYESLARHTLEIAEIRQAQAEEAEIPQTELSAALTLIQKARSFLQEEKYRSALTRAEDAVQHLEYLLASYKPENEGISGRFARVMELHGVVEVLEPGRADWKLVGLNEILRNGARVKTRKSSTATLKFDDGSSIHIKSNSLVMIRELVEDDMTKMKWSNIELGESEIEALIKEPNVQGSNFTITLPDKSEANIQEESNLSVKVNNKNRSVVKVFMGRVDIHSGERQVALSTREAVVLDPRGKNRNQPLEPISIPLPPRLIYPANVQLLTMNRFNQNPIYFRWTTVDDAEAYQIELATDYYFYELVEDKKLEDNRAKLTKLPPGNYYWRVSSLNQSSLSSEPSPFNSFRIALTDDLQSKNKDLTPPTIRIDRITVLGHIVDVSGRTESNASLYVNEQKEEVFEDGSFRALIDFKQAGLQEIYLEVYDSAGNVTTKRKAVRIQETSLVR